MSKEYWSEYYQSNKETCLSRAKQWYIDNKDRKKLYDKMRREQKREELSAFEKERAKLPHRKAAHNEESRRRKMVVKQASPLWLSEFDLFHIQEIYHLAQLRTKALGVAFHVDHIVPLRGKTVCGLHVPSNLQLLPAKENISKGNRVEFQLSKAKYG